MLFRCIISYPLDTANKISIIFKNFGLLKKRSLRTFYDKVDVYVLDIRYEQAKETPAYKGVEGD